MVKIAFSIKLKEGLFIECYSVKNCINEIKISIKRLKNTINRT